MRNAVDHLVEVYGLGSGPWTITPVTRGALGQIWKLSGQAATAFGVPDRGFIREGLVADLVAFDMETVAPAEFERRYDFPAGADRLTAQSVGVEHVWVAGTAIRRDGVDLDDAELEGGCPGTLLSPVSRV